MPPIRVRSAGDDSVPPPLRDPDRELAAVHAICLADIVYRSRCAEWVRADPDRRRTGLDFCHAVQKPARDAGTMPAFPNRASYAAWVLSLPAPPVEWKDQT